MNHRQIYRQPSVYIMASGRNGTLYIGVTMNLSECVWQHKSKTDVDVFTARYNVNKLVWYEYFADMPTAIAQEKVMKKWRREWKIRLIEEHNSDWLDLFGGLVA